MVWRSGRQIHLSAWTFFVFFGAMVCFAREPMDWSRPGAIDPLNKNVADFLDADLSSVERDAIRAYSKGKYLDAAQFYLFLLHHRSGDATSLYNLACCYAKMGEGKHAARFLEKAVAAGFVDVAYALKDPDFEPVKQEAAFEKAVARMKREQESLGRIMFVPACKLVKCHVHLPKDFDPEKETTLVIALHGNGGRADNLIQLWDKMDHRDFVFAAPDGAYPRPTAAGGAGGGFSWEIRIRDKELWRRGDPLTIAYISQVVEQFSSMMRIKEVYLLGFSQGAAYAYLAGISRPDLFAGVICFGGKLPDLTSSYSVCSPEDLVRAKNLGVFIGHGTQDRAISINAALDAKNRLEAAEYDVTFRRFEGCHEIPGDVLNAALAWMKRRTKAKPQ